MKRKTTNLVIVLLSFLIAALIALAVFMTWFTKEQTAFLEKSLRDVKNEHSVQDSSDTADTSDHIVSSSCHHFLFVGDSRTVGMEEAMQDSDDADTCSYIGKVGEGYYWLVNEGIDQLRTSLSKEPDATVVFNLGVNDLSEIDRYLAFYPQIFAEYPDASFYIMSVNPVGDACSGASNEEIRKTIANMIFIDAYIRFYFREKIIKTLVDHKINVHCVGKGWNRLQCKHPEYLTFEEGQLSKGCLERIANAKISLNIMPWFKDGAHDRVFNSMANGAVCVTDTNRYLCCELTDRENVIFYDLSNIEALPDLVNSILQNPKKAKKIARNAYTLTMRKHTWANRANDLLRFIHTLS